MPIAHDIADLDRPVPYTLTLKATAALDAARDTCPGHADNGWSCARCTDAYFGAAPDSGLCPGCQNGGAVR